ncbi:MAG: hypothetical protein KF699_05615 [Phycisphaeraceae bacterium]|nr:hypothetical protein [Phycisphaeraceae bacterium]
MQTPRTGQIPLLDDAPCAQYSRAGDAGGWSAAPACHAAAAVFDGAQRPVLLAATGDLRAWARRRLASAPAEWVLHAVPCSCMMEADLAYLGLARRLAPAAASLAAERVRAWWACIDPGAEFPEWSKSNLVEGAIAPRSATRARGGAGGVGEALGPFADKDSAGRFIEAVIDAFDLCREHRLLVLAPAAQACAYKEMGRCAAPCDGSESMESYRARVRAAVEAVTGGAGALAGLRGDVERRMRAAAAANEFESAAACKAQAERFSRLAGGAFARVRRLADFRFVLVWRGPREGWVRIGACRGGQVAVFGDAAVAAARRSAAGSEGARELAAAARDWAARPAAEWPSGDEVGPLGVLAREYAAPSTRRCAWFVPINPDESADVWMRGVVDAAAACLRPRTRGSERVAAGAGRAGAPGGDHELELLPE